MSSLPPTIFDTTYVPTDHPVFARPYSSLPLEALVEAARIVTAYPGSPEVQKFLTQVVTLRITPEEYDELQSVRATIRLSEIANAPEQLHQS